MSTSPNHRWNTPPPVYDAYSPPQSSTTLKPYLQLPHLLSLTWIAYPIISLLFVIFRLQLSSASAQDAVDNAKGDLLTSCKAAEQAATAAASMPRYLAAATNAQLTDAVNGTMNAARATMVLALTVMEAIINFIIDTYRSTFLCFLELVVRGGLDLLIGAVQELSNFVTNTLNSARTSIQNDISSANSAIQSVVAGINKVNPFGDISVPQFSIPSLTALENVTLPTDFENALVSLNSSLPTLSDLKDTIDSIVDTPFELLKKDINDTFIGLQFDVNALPVPAQNTLTFCDDMDTSVVDDLGRDLVKIAEIGTIILIVLLFLLIAANCALEWYKWRALKQHLQRTREAWTSDPSVRHVVCERGTPMLDMTDHNLMILQASSAHPLLMKLANKLSVWFHLSPSQYTHLQFFFHYVFHPPALACFLIGFFGLLCVELQLIAIGPLSHKYSQQAAAAVSDFSNVIATSINASMYNQSATYANAVNARVDSVQSTINDGMFGWVNGTTTTLNDTINTFYTDIQNAVGTVFNGTVLESPVQEFIRCLIGSKVDAIENALTFLHDNLYVDIPRPIAAAAIGGGQGDNEGLVGRLVAAYESSLKKERIMFGIFMGLWGLVVLMALCIIFWHSYGRDMARAYGRRRWRKTQRAGIDGIVVPFRDRSTVGGGASHVGGDVDAEKTQVELHSFTPMPSPNPRTGPFDSVRASTRGNAGKDGLLQPPSSHPLSVRKPVFEKSWDNLLDGASNHPAPVEEQAPPKISGPMKLMAIGRKAMGRERFAEDEKAEDTTEVETSQSSSLFGRMTGGFWKKGQKDEQSAEGSTRSKARPQLTISTAHASAGPTANLPTVEMTSPDARPIPAWSMSPGPPPPPSKLPWMTTVEPTRQLSLPVAPHHKSRRTANVPTDVSSVYDSLSLVVPQPRVPVVVPLHLGFDSPAGSHNSVTFGPHTFMPPPIHPSRIPDPTISSNSDTTMLVTQHFTTNHVWRSSQAVDPFVTPFDDEHRVQNRASKPSSPAGAGTPTNPFIVMAF
ncbi:Plasma membrane fusion protein PRM1 [Grifola frondosa]|uniref:Plasma membrane fusion protein PRM1 n=1 Tax=Grifola frondosa TaxID=5627 RepID=A0A1C7M2U2_GRIFR|nr:Plasma membrane fusion protein PRM1 [Grifola frondosa]